MSHAIPPQSTLWPVLFKIDSAVRDVVQTRGCPRCAGRLDRADYPRKPRGAPRGGMDDEVLAIRLGLCCSATGCRRRAHLPSVRFLGRRVYLGIIVVLLAAWRQGPTPKRMKVLCATFDVDRRTVERWCRWWTEEFPKRAVWRGLRGRLRSSVEPLPLRLVTAFDAEHDPHAQARLLRALDPLP